ncbi:MAG: response regulator transcription factor [Chthoniobacterales bacterium]|nr:response regulator transcription factor [Chthoniobacterales bacterium]
MGFPEKLSVLIVHHAPLMRFGLATLIRSSRRFRIAGETGEAPTARRLFAQTKPSLVVLSLSLRQGDGFSLLKDFRKMDSSARAVVVTARQDSLSLQRAFKAGARGFVVTEDEAVEVLDALEQVAAGELYASGTVSRRLLQMLARGQVEIPQDGCGRLSDRELQVFRLIGSGLGTSRVASEMHLSVKTIETHRQRIKQKLGLTTGTELTQRATQFLLEAARRRSRPGGFSLSSSR